MAKSTGKNMTLTFAATPIQCLQSVETSWDIDVTEVECAGATAKEKIVGLPSYSMTVNGALDTTSAATQLNAVNPGDAGTVSFSPFSGTTFSSTNGIVTSGSVSAPVSGVVAYSFTIQLDNLTIA